jgi:hypothetical protein
VKVEDRLSEHCLTCQINLAVAYDTDGQSIKSIETFEHVAELQETLPEDHQDRLGFQHELATTYLDNRRTTEAIELLEHVVKVRK